MGPTHKSCPSPDEIVFPATFRAWQIRCRGKQFGCSCQPEFYGIMPGYPNRIHTVLLQLSEVSTKKQVCNANRWKLKEQRAWKQTGSGAEELVFHVTSHGSKANSGCHLRFFHQSPASLRQFSSPAYTFRALVRESDGGELSSWCWVQLSNTCTSVISTITGVKKSPAGTSKGVSPHS